MTMSPLPMPRDLRKFAVLSDQVFMSAKVKTCLAFPDCTRPLHGGGRSRYVVNDVIAEVEGIGIVKRNDWKRLVLSVGLLYVAQVYVSLMVPSHNASDYLFVRWLYNDSQEYDRLAIEGEKSMTSRRVVHE